MLFAFFLSHQPLQGISIEASTPPKREDMKTVTIPIITGPTAATSVTI
jgi:hypothetical protein